MRTVGVTGLNKRIFLQSLTLKLVKLHETVMAEAFFGKMIELQGKVFLKEFLLSNNLQIFFLAYNGSILRHVEFSE